ncbi:two-component system activity regulator YycH [Bacillus tianshenii]|nr:two-component system activity regulator YycH [Bacillus tianshenii]
MNLEHAKAVVLTLLVSLSFMLTWGLWTYQPQYETINDNTYLQEVAIGNKRSLAEIVQPELVVYHEDDKHFGMRKNEDIQAFNQQLTKWEAKSIEDVSAAVKEKGLPSFIRQNGSTEVIYPTSIPSYVFSKLFKTSEQIALQSVDRLLIRWPDQGKNKFTMYFISMDEQKVVRATIEQNIAQGMKAARKRASNNLEYFVYPINATRYLYLPDEKVNIPRLTYSAQLLESGDFKNALFNDPTVVKQYGSGQGERSFTDGTRALEVFHNDMLMRYVNPTDGEAPNEKSKQMLLNGIEFINDHSGWTDFYRLNHWDGSNQDVTYRLIVGNLPVFNLKNTQELVTIQQSFRDEQIYEYSRSLLNLRFKLDKESEQETVPSGYKLIQALKKTFPKYSPEKLNRATLGYQFVPVGYQASVVQFKPVWYVQYNGKWYKINLTDQGGSANGLE